MIVASKISLIKLSKIMFSQYRLNWKHIIRTFVPIRRSNHAYTAPIWKTGWLYVWMWLRIIFACQKDPGFARIMQFTLYNIKKHATLSKSSKDLLNLCRSWLIKKINPSPSAWSRDVTVDEHPFAHYGSVCAIAQFLCKLHYLRAYLIGKISSTFIPKCDRVIFDRNCVISPDKWLSDWW